MIAIDSDVLRSLASVADSAAQEMTSAAEKLNNVTVHDDWNCAERDIINEHIISVKKKTTALQNKTQSFLELIRNTANKFDIADSNINLSFVNLQNTVSDYLSVVSTTESISPNTTLSKVIQLPSFMTDHWTEYHDYWTKYLLSNFGSSIKVCKYSDVDFSKLN